MAFDTPIWKMQTITGPGGCECSYRELFDAIPAVYQTKPVLYTHCDVAHFCPVHPLAMTPSQHALWINGNYYNPRALIGREKQWFRWRVRSRVRYEVAYAAARNRGLGVEAAYADVIPAALHPGLDEQVPPARIEDRYTRGLVAYSEGGDAPWARKLPDGPDAEPSFPSPIPPPTPAIIAERSKHWGWMRLESEMRSDAFSLAKMRNDTVDFITSIEWSFEGVGDRILHVDYQGEFSVSIRDQFQSALDIQFGPGKVIVDG